MKNPRRKIFFSVMGVSFILTFAWLFVYIEERKFEAHYYKSELERLQQAASPALLELIQTAEEGSALALLRHSPRLARLNGEQSRTLIGELRQSRTPEQRDALARHYGLNGEELAALAALLHGTAQP